MILRLLKPQFLLTCRIIMLSVGFVLAFMASTKPGFANVCRGIQAELANMRSAREDNRFSSHYANEAARLNSHMQSIGCDRQSFLMFGQPAPRECQAYRAQLAQLRSAVGSSQQNSARRQQLLSMQISHSCRSNPSTSLTAGLFDDGSRRSQLEVRPNTRIDPDEDEAPLRIESRIRSIGGKAVCVRLCDGYHFPLDVKRGSLKDAGEEACQALCPMSETKVFLKTGEIENARSLEGENYTALPNALRYRKTFDPSCTCRQEGETLASNMPKLLNPDGARSNAPFGVLNPDQTEVDDIIPLRGVTTDSISRDLGKGKKINLFGAAKIPEPPSPPQEPPEFPADRMILSTQGEIRQFPLQDGTMRPVRVIGTSPADGPKEAVKASAPARDPGQ